MHPTPIGPPYGSGPGGRWRHAPTESLFITRTSKGPKVLAAPTQSLFITKTSEGPQVLKDMIIPHAPPPP